MTVRSARNNNETWRAVVGYEGLYEVSSLGAVRTVTRAVRIGGILRIRESKNLKQWPDKDGYLVVYLFKRSKRLGRRVAHLVAAAFLGPRPVGQNVCHNDGSRSNNTKDNLRYATQKENIGDKKKHGTYRSGERAYNAKLSWRAVAAIRKASKKTSNESLGKLYKVSRTAVYHVRINKTWKEPRV